MIIASRTWEEHLQQLDEYFARCEQHKVFLHPLKCEFGVEEIEYLGLKVSKNRLQISDDKIAAVKAYNTPDSYPGSPTPLLGVCQLSIVFYTKSRGKDSTHVRPSTRRTKEKEIHMEPQL